MVSLLSTSAKSNEMANIFLKSIPVQKIAYSSIYDTFMPTEHFEVKNKDLRLLIRLKIDSYQLCL